jgi:hypothetical protein
MAVLGVWVASSFPESAMNTGIAARGLLDFAVSGSRTVFAIFGAWRPLFAVGQAS